MIIVSNKPGYPYHNRPTRRLATVRCRPTGSAAALSLNQSPHSEVDPGCDKTFFYNQHPLHYHFHHCLLCRQCLFPENLSHSPGTFPILCPKDESGMCILREP